MAGSTLGLKQDLFLQSICVMKQSVLAFVFLVILASCESGNNVKEIDSSRAVASDQSEDKVFEKATKIFYAMPSPLEMTTLIKSAGGTFNGTLLHDAQMAGQYQTKLKQSLNLGIYGSDLSYSSVYDQRQNAIKYLAACKRVGEKLGITEAFSAEMIEKANANIDNRDSIMKIITDLYWLSNSQLNEENRHAVSILVMAAGWVEGIYLGSNIIDLENPDPEISQRLMEQKYTALQIEAMFAENADDPLVTEGQSLFSPLLSFYSSLQVNEEKPIVEYSESTGVSRIAGEKKIVYTSPQLKELRTLSTTIRNQIIEL